MIRAGIVAVVAGVLAVASCTKATTVPPVDAEPAAGARPDAAADDPPLADAAHEAADDDASELPPPWWTPRPEPSLDPLSEQEIATANACADADDIVGPNVTAAELVDIARCLEDARALGKALLVYKRVVSDHPDAAQTVEALRAIGELYERVDDRPHAVSAYADYLRRYPKNDDARALGQRAVCLARSLEDNDTVDALLRRLERDYGHRGFVRPPHSAFPQLCAGLPQAR